MTSDGMLEVDLRLPPEMGGEGGGTNPEELFAVGYAACFESALGGTMPPSTSGEQPWSEDKVQLFKQWMDGGYAP